MGTQFLIGTRTMKFLVVLALVAAAYAEPEAEANAEAEPWWYSNYGYASPYYSGYRYGYSPYYNWGGYRYLWKRDAEAQPEADAEAEPWWYSHYGYGGYARAYASPYWNRWGYAYSPYYNWGGLLVRKLVRQAVGRLGIRIQAIRLRILRPQVGLVDPSTLQLKSSSIFPPHLSLTCNFIQ